MKSGYISRVQQDDKNKRRFHIYVEDELVCTVHEEVLLKYQLFKGTYLDETIWSELISAEEENNAYLAAIRLLSFRPRTAYELEQALKQRGYSAELAAKIRQQCEQQGYINDQEFANQWIRDRMRLKPRGRQMLQLELQQKGIDSALIEAALQQLDADEELSAARKLAEKKLRHATRPLSLQEQQKLSMYLLRKGFSRQIVYSLRGEWAHEREE